MVSLQIGCKLNLFFLHVFYSMSNNNYSDVSRECSSQSWSLSEFKYTDLTSYSLVEELIKLDLFTRQL